MKSGDKIRILIDGWDYAGVLAGDILIVESVNHEVFNTTDGWGFDIKGLEEGGFELVTTNISKIKTLINDLGYDTLPVTSIIESNQLSVKFKKIRPDAVTPSYAKDGDGGLDITATSLEIKANSNQYVYGTGLAFEIPEGYVGLLFPRSSICKTRLSLSNAVGVLDSGYRGEVKFVFNVNVDSDKDCYNCRDKIGQLIIMPYPKVTLEEVEELSDTERGTGGFGSTGK